MKLHDEAKLIKEAFDKEVENWQADDDASDAASIGIVIDGIEYSLGMFAADMLHAFGVFIDTVIDVAEEEGW